MEPKMECGGQQWPRTVVPRLSRVSLGADEINPLEAALLLSQHSWRKSWRKVEAAVFPVRPVLLVLPETSWGFCSHYCTGV